MRRQPLLLAMLCACHPAMAAEPLLPGQTVTAKGYAADARETPQMTEVLEPGGAQAAVAGELFRGEPGLAVQSDGAWGQNPVLRGLKKESIVVMVDGLRLNAAQPQGAIASFTDLGLIDRIEVVKGPSSVLYGSGALGGAVNLMTPEARLRAEAGIDGRLGISSGSIDRVESGALLLDAGNADHALVFGAAARDVSDYDSAVGTEPDTGYRSASLLAKYKYRVSDDTALRLNVQRHTDEDVWYPGSARTGGQPGGAGIPPPLGTVTIHSPEQERELQAIGLDTVLGGGQLNVDVYRQDVFRQIRAHSSTLQRDYVRNDVTFSTDGARTQYRFGAGESHLLTLGAEGWRMTGDPERYMDNNPPLFNNNVRNDPFSDGRIAAAGLFLQDEISLDAGQLLAGVRYDRVSGTAKQKGTGPAAQTTGLAHEDEMLSWSLGFVRPLGDTLSAYANLAQAHRAADMRERFEDSARGDGYYHLGNPQLDPERSTGLELGVKAQDGEREYRLATFYTRIDDYIAGRVTGTIHPGSGLPIKRTENLDEVVIRGVEGAAAIPVAAFVIDGAFTWLRGDNRQDSEPLHQMPAPEVRVGIGQPNEAGFHWRAQVRGVDRQDRVATVFSGGGEDVTPGFMTVDAELGWRFGAVAMLESADVTLALGNLLDRAYHEHLADGIAGHEPAAPGRNFTLSLAGRF